jgi:hypothetical protein
MYGMGMLAGGYRHRGNMLLHDPGFRPLLGDICQPGLNMREFALGEQFICSCFHLTPGLEIK